MAANLSKEKLLSDFNIKNTLQPRKQRRTLMMGCDIEIIYSSHGDCNGKI